MQSSPVTKAAGEHHLFSRLYGAVQGLATQDGIPKPPAEWESRGTILGLLIDVGSASASKAFLLVTLTVSVRKHSSEYMQCSQADLHLKGFSERLICEYTKAYVFTFPALATVVLLLLVGRDLLQKRIYYGLLKAGGVLSFTGNAAWKDPLVLALCVNCLHCMWYLCFQINVRSRAVKSSEAALVQLVGMDSATALGSQSTALAMDGNGVMALVLLLTTFFPIILLIIFFFLAYDMEKSLVPLSEYLNAFEDEEHDVTSMPQLCVCKDSVAKHMMQLNQDLITATEGNLAKVYEGIVAGYVKKKADFRPSALAQGSSQHPSRWVSLPSIGLMRALWPAELLMRRDLVGASVRHFQHMWIGFMAVALGWLTYIQVFLIQTWVDDVSRLLDGHLDQLLPLTVILGSVAAVAGTMWALASTLGSFCASRRRGPQ